MQTFSRTDTGRTRTVNQDYLICEENAVGKFPNLFVVADGMGGHNAGDIASHMCVEEVVSCVRNSDKITPVGILEEAIQNANKCICQKASQDDSLEGMGTTIVATTVIDAIAYIANVGDSRLYLLSDSLRQITEDHSLVEEMVRSGELQKEEMRTHPNKNIITRALGTKEAVQADCFEIEVKSGDVLLLCSDGLSNMVSDEQMERIIRENKSDITKAGQKLVDQANEAGGRDNITVILIQL